MTKIQKREQRDEVNRYLSFIVLLYVSKNQMSISLIGCDGVIAEFAKFKLLNVGLLSKAHNPLYSKSTIRMLD